MNWAYVLIVLLVSWLPLLTEGSGSAKNSRTGGWTARRAKRRHNVIETPTANFVTSPFETVFPALTKARQYPHSTKRAKLSPRAAPAKTTTAVLLRSCD
jgi:hypothetical protein